MTTATRTGQGMGGRRLRYDPEVRIIALGWMGKADFSI
jgi:hypothetical protein